METKVSRFYIPRGQKEEDFDIWTAVADNDDDDRENRFSFSGGKKVSLSTLCLVIRSGFSLAETAEKTFLTKKNCNT